MGNSNSASKAPVPDIYSIDNALDNAFFLCNELVRTVTCPYDEKMQILQRLERLSGPPVSRKAYNALQSVCEEIVTVLRADHGVLFPCEVLLIYIRIAKSGRFESTPEEMRNCLERIHQYWANRDALETEFRALRPSHGVFRVSKLLQDNATVWKSIEKLQHWLQGRNSKIALRNLGPVQKEHEYHLIRCLRH